MRATEYADQPKPVKADDILELARQFRRRWSVKRLARVGLYQHVREILWDLLDSGEILLLTLSESEALTEFLSHTGAADRAYDDHPSVSTSLRGAIKKIYFVEGRNYGLTNFDMGIREDDDEPATTA